MKYSDKVLEFAKLVVDECQGAHDAFCVSACPMHTEAKEYVNLIGEGKNLEALLKVREKLFLPGSLGRICAHPCEIDCRRNTDYNQPIAIAALKRFVADKEDREEIWDISKKAPTGKKIAVIGAGPAGAQAAIDMAKEGHEVVIFEKLPVVGGMMHVGIPEYRLPRDVINFEYKYLENLGIEIKLNVEIGKDIAFETLKADYDAVIVANGAHKGSLPKVPGIEANGVTNAADFLREVSLTKKSTLLGKNVVVIGGGDVAMDCVRTSKRLGCDNVYLVYRRAESEMPSSLEEIHHSKEEGIVFHCNFNATDIEQTDGRVSKFNFIETVTRIDGNGKPGLVNGEKTLSLECDTIIYATGQIVEDATDGVIAQGWNGRYECDEKTMATADAKVFVAGDCAGATLVVEAMALGRKAAISANRFLEGKDIVEGRDFKYEYAFKSALDIPAKKGTQDLPRNHTDMVDPAVRITNFLECDLGFDDETALNEASRCMECECKRCMTECIMMNDFAEYPGEFMEKLLANNEMSETMTYSCNMCDQCTIACPKEFKFSAFFGDARKDMVKANNGESPMAGHKSIKMHQLLGFSSLFCTKKRGK